MARLPLFDLATVPGPLGETLRARPPLNLYRLLPHAPAIATGFLGLGRAVLGQSSLDPQWRELAILRVGALSDAHYEIHQHTKLARSVGVDEAKIEAVLSTADSDAFTVAERALLAFTDAVVKHVKAPDEVYARMAEYLGPTEQLELVTTIGFYMLVSRVLENFELELETDEVSLQGVPHD